MARRPVRRGRAFGRGRRPGGTWARFVEEAATVGASTKQLRVVGLLSNPGIGETIRRTVGGLYVNSDQTAGSENQFGAFGLIVVSDLAIAAGVASIPGPFTDRNDDGWFMWQGFSQGIRVATAAGFGDYGKWYPFDSRAMRKVEEGFGIALVVENGDPADGLLVGFSVSIYATRN